MKILTAAQLQKMDLPTIRAYLKERRRWWCLPWKVGRLPQIEYGGLESDCTTTVVAKLVADYRVRSWLERK